MIVYSDRFVPKLSKSQVIGELFKKTIEEENTARANINR